MNSPGLRPLFELLIGIDEIQWAQAEGWYRERFLRKAEQQTPGLFLPPAPGGGPDTQWEVSYNLGSDVVSVSAVGTLWQNSGPQVAMAVDSDGKLWRLEAQSPVTIPNDDTWYTVVATRAEVQTEAGTITITSGSAVVAGTGTDFTRFSGKTSSGFGRGTRIWIAAGDSAGGNGGIYEIDVVTSATSITLTTVPPGTTETISRWKVAGDFLSTIPADPAIHNFERVVISKVARTTIPAAGAFILADVKRNNAGSPKVKIIDRRQANELWTVPEPFGCWLAPEIGFDTSSPWTAATMRRDPMYGSSTSGQTVSVAALRDNGEELIAVIVDGTNIELAIRENDGAGWYAGGAVVTGATDPDAAIVQTPDISGTTHVVVFVDGNSLWCTASANSGSTWGAPVLILDPTTNDAADEVRTCTAIMLQNNRLLVVLSYYDDSGASGAGQERLVAVYSDDYGVTWSTNTNVGYNVVQIQSVVGAPTFDNISRPSLYQARDGTIFCAFDVDDTEIQVIRSADATGIGWGALTVQPNGYTCPTITDWEFRDPAIWVDPGGCVVVLMSGKNTNTDDHALWGWSWHISGEGTITNRVDRLFTSNNAALETRTLAPAIYHGVGALELVWLDTNSGTGDFVSGPVQVQRLPARRGVQR